MHNWNLKRGKREWEGAIYKKMMAKDLSKLIKDNNPQIQKVLQIPRRINTIKKTHLSISHLNCWKPKKNFLKAASGKKDTLPSTEQLLLDFWIL